MDRIGGVEEGDNIEYEWTGLEKLKRGDNIEYGWTGLEKLKRGDNIECGRAGLKKLKRGGLLLAEWVRYRYRFFSVDTLHYNALVFYLCDEKIKSLYMCFLRKENEIVK